MATASTQGARNSLKKQDRLAADVPAPCTTSTDSTRGDILALLLWVAGMLVLSGLLIQDILAALFL